MPATYFAYLCYPHDNCNSDEEIVDSNPEIKFEEPLEWKYEKILPIQFSILHSWSNKDKELYK